MVKINRVQGQFSNGVKHVPPPQPVLDAKLMLALNRYKLSTIEKDPAKWHADAVVAVMKAVPNLGKVAVENFVRDRFPNHCQ